MQPSICCSWTVSFKSLRRPNGRTTPPRAAVSHTPAERGSTHGPELSLQHIRAGFVLGVLQVCASAQPSLLQRAGVSRGRRPGLRMPLLLDDLASGSAVWSHSGVRHRHALPMRHFCPVARDLQRYESSWGLVKRGP